MTSSQEASAGAGVWTTRRLLAWMTDAFVKAGLDSPRLSAELLVSNVIGCDRLKLYTDVDRPASPLERDRLRDLVGRALKQEPVQYLVGEGWFFGLPYHVDKSVLIPRPATETAVEQVLLHARAEPGFGGKAGEGVRLVDVGTGSGCIAISLLKQLPRAVGIGIDVSPAALATAAKNARRHKVDDRLELLDGDLLGPLVDHPDGAGFHYIISNPPYIPDYEWDLPGLVWRNVREYEPHLALRGGADGLQFIRPLVAMAPGRLRPGGLLVIEAAASTAKEVGALFETGGGFERVRVVKDHEGLERVVIGTRRA